MAQAIVEQLTHYHVSGEKKATMAILGVWLLMPGSKRRAAAN